jgi:rSAM/selenodomain-associated transferase 1
MKKALIIFVKAPVPGTVKTRLQADMGADKTVEIYKSFVSMVTSQCTDLNGVDRFLGCAPSTDHEFLCEIAEKNGMEMFSQRGDTLGDRIFNAFKYCAEKGYTEIALIGSDSPSMPVDFIEQAFSRLKDHDIVIGPCFDLGLYLIGIRKDKVSELARTIELDTGKDVSSILEKADQLNIKVSMLPFWYDIDHISDYQFLQTHRNYLKKLSSASKG